MLGQKQETILKIIEKDGRISLAQVKTLYYERGPIAKSTLLSMEMMGWIKQKETLGLTVWVRGPKFPVIS